MSSATGLKRRFESGSTTTTLALTAGLLIALAVVSRVFYPLVQLDEAAYRTSSVTLAALRTPRLLLAVVVPAAVVVGLRRDLRWSDVPDGRLVRLVVLAAAASLLVSLAFYEPNWFFGQSHLADRALLVGLFALSIWRPIALVPFTVLAAVLASQFAVPLGRYTWNDKRLIFDVVILFGLAAGAGLVRRREGLRAFVGAVGVVVVSWYLIAGVGKIALGWPGREQLANMTRSAHLAGWLSAGTADRMAEAVASLNWLLVPAAIVVEVAAVLLLLGRRPALAVLAALPGLHLLVFALSGIFFWKWMVVEIALLVFFLRCDRETLAGFGPALVLLALPFAALAPRLFGVATLAWYDTPYSVNLELEAVGESGTVYRVDRGHLAPYEVLAAQGRLGFVAQPPILVGSLGTALDWRVASAVTRARSAADLAEAEAELAVSQYQPDDAMVFDHFVRARFDRWSGQPALGPPHHIWTGRAPSVLDVPPTAFDGQEDVVEVRVRMHKVWWDGEGYRPLADCVVRSVPMDPAAGPSYVAPPTACAL
jgi:hypothetical protein